MREKPISEQSVTRNVSIPMGLLVEMIKRNISPSTAIREGLKTLLEQQEFQRKIIFLSEEVEKKNKIIDECEVCRGKLNSTQSK